MAKNNQPEVSNEQKVQTKYDRKMEERKKKEVKDRRQDMLTRIGAIIVCAGIVIAIVASIGISVVNKNQAVKNTYVTIGSHELTKVEYDYYYKAAVNNYLTTYQSVLAYTGLDMTKDFDEQEYSEGFTWKDMFDQMAVGNIQQIKALVDDAAANGFAYDSTENYAGVLTNISTSAEEAGISVADYYKETFGNYATEKNMESIIKEGLLANAYNAELLTKNLPNEQEIDKYYEEHTKEYDKVDYRSFAVSADIAEGAADEDIEKAMTGAKEKADAMMEARQGGADFKQLCLDNATGENKEIYKDTEKDASFNEARDLSTTPNAIAGWLYEEGRKDGDITVIEDKTNHQYYVVEFANRYYDEADDANISQAISGERTNKYIADLAQTYTVTDNKGDLKYLTVDTSADDEEETDTVPEETEAAE